MNDNELMNRRRFFKKAAKGLLPMLGAFAAAPTVLASLTSCGGCDDCEAACMDDCESTCSGTCSDGCSGGSTDTLCSDCSSTCSGSSTGATCSECNNSCSNECSGTSTGSSCSECGNNCSNTCVGNCLNSCSTECLNTCKTACTSSCSGTCENSCSSTCEGTAQGKSTTGSVAGHNYIDLGLSVLWATCNVGASSPEKYGEYYGFADTKGKTGLTDDFNINYLMSYDFIYGAQYDAAHVKWGDKWRMPSKGELQELCSYCDFSSTKENGINVIKATSKINGNSIIFPCAGHYWDNDNTSGYGTDRGYYDQEKFGSYWSGDFYNKNRYGRSGYTLEIAKEKFIISEEYAYVAQGSQLVYFCYPIRPVLEKSGQGNSCNGSCTAVCSSDCTSTCKNQCQDTCIGQCKGSCSGGCQRTCSGSCSESCTDGCKTGCKTGCQTTCKGTCSTSCTSSCTGGCGESCSSSCRGTCSTGCGNGCTGSCQTDCQFGCIANCANDCSSGCSGGCGGSCRGTCVTGCTGTCYNTCNDTCFGSCRITCEGWSK